MHIRILHSSPGTLTHDRVIFKRDGNYHLLREMDDDLTRIIYLRLLESDQAHQKLKALKRYGITEPREQIRQFATCNFARLDSIDDLDDNGNLNFEFVPCSCRNHGCKFNSEICIRNY